MKPLYFFVILLVFYSFLSCEKDLEWDNTTDSLYFNSFESSSDTIGWRGVSENDIIKDTPESGGSKSLKVSGGCVIPHVQFKTVPLTEDCRVVLKCWGKNLSNGGGISLHKENESGSIYISVSETSWTNYISNDTLNCPAGNSLILQLNSGGFMSSAMLVDLVEIVKVNH